ncbi:hypothetical protein FB192DRAFT_1286277 [Mucor lusitanicus]|uniref:Cyclin N-terminal domain-containing protein n=1 Tax=Mucor circinelloides f. lusitanicus TaxID=29924 RepID=A0A8H4BCI6_MUCCL|nr:hypothetical protein FB192DRAFT_1286277 [Mucor lusitanicus]
MANDLQPPEKGRLPSAATHFAGPLVATTNNPTPLSTNDCKYSEELPCEKYRQFMDFSRQERTFMIEKLVETFANVIDSIWHPKFLIEHQKVKVMPTRGFCNEILKRSKTTYSTLQISLFYVFRVKKVVHEKLYQRIQQQQQQQQSGNMQTNTCSTTTQMDDLMCCGRRMFLASLMLASKYLHDKNYHNKAWSKITGLDIKEINAAEMAFLKLIDYRLYVSKPTFDRWYTQLHGHIQKGYNAKSELPSNNNFSATTPSATIVNFMGTTYERADSGVSFDILSPPSSQPSATTTGGSAKRQYYDDDISSATINKRLCQ